MRKAAIGYGFFAVSLGIAIACGPSAPPKQAQEVEAADPLADSATPPLSAAPDGQKSVDPLSGPAAGGKLAVGKGGDAPQVQSLSAFLDGFKWGMTHAEVQKVFTQTGGIIWKDYDEKLTKARVGPEQTALEAERESSKAAFARTYTEFKDIPTGFDTTGIRGEFSYRNKESLMWITRKGKKRWFFFINDRLWKIYDEVPFADDGAYGASFPDAVNRLNAQLNAQGRYQVPNEKNGLHQNTVDWKDAANHLRAVDRTNERLVGIVIEDGATLSNLAALRPNKLPDPTEIDPSIKAVTQGKPSDPNAAPSAAPAGSGKKPPPKKK